MNVEIDSGVILGFGFVGSMDEPNVSVTQGGDSSEEEVFNVSKIQKADTKGPLAKVPWSKQGTPY